MDNYSPMKPMKGTAPKGGAAKAALLARGRTQTEAPKGDWPVGPAAPSVPQLGTAQSAFRYCVSCGEAGHGKRLCMVTKAATYRPTRAQRAMARKSVYGVSARDTVERTLPGFAATLQGGSLAMAQPADSPAARRAIASAASVQWRETRRQWRERGII